MNLTDFPKVLLHDHLDGGLRPETLVKLSQKIGYEKLPSYDAAELQEWILGNSKRGKLELYLEAFEHTIAVMQTPEAIEQIAYECGQDFAQDGIIYAESRFAPELFREKGMALDEIMEAAVEGFERASREFGVKINVLCSGMKQFHNSVEIAELAVRWLGRGVVGFDLAGPEEGFLCSEHLEAIQTAKKGGAGITLHAGEGAGLDSIADALNPSGAERIGHGVRIIDDISNAALGELAAEVKERQIPLEVCPTSNLHTAVAESFKTHPLRALFELGFLITLNTDNRLMSRISLTQEFQNCYDSYGWDMEEFKKLTLNAINSAFCTEQEKQEMAQRLDKAI